MVMVRARLFILGSRPYIPSNLDIHPPLTFTIPHPLTNFHERLTYLIPIHTQPYTRAGPPKQFSSHCSSSIEHAEFVAPSQFEFGPHSRTTHFVLTHTITHTFAHNGGQGFVSRPRAGEAPTFILRCQIHSNVRLPTYSLLSQTSKAQRTCH